MTDDFASLRADLNFIANHLGLSLPGTPAGEPLHWIGEPQLGNTTAYVNWVPNPDKDVASTKVSRSGTDTQGTGPWSGFVDTETGFTFANLKPGAAYLLTVSVAYGDDTSEMITITVTMPPAVVTPPVGRGWLSGPSDGPGVILAWKGFRKQETTFAGTWADQGLGNMLALPALDDVTAGGYTGVLDLAIGGPSDWAGAARGDFDATWTSQCRRALQLYRGLKGLHLRMAHEFNNTGSYLWQISAGEQADFRKAYPRFYAIVQKELVAKGKNVKVVLPFNSDTNGGWTAKDGMPPSDSFDIVGVDYYSSWPAIPNQAAWDDMFMKMKGDTPRGLGAWVRFAQVWGKPLSLPEWGLNNGEKNNTVDNPFWIRRMNEFFRSIAPAYPYNPGPGELAGEAYFNNYVYNGQLYPSAPSAPQSRAAYLGLTWGTM